MRTIAFVSIVAYAAAIKVMDDDYPDYIGEINDIDNISVLEQAYNNLLGDFDYDDDGKLNLDEYLDVMTYLDED